MDGESREAVLGPARDETVAVPLAIVRAGAEVAELAALAIEHGNPNLRSDARVACVLAAAGARAATVTMSANLASSSGDLRLAEATQLAKAAEARARSGS
jgi:formiminotetrahydrofolate cyclodeaminase